MDGTPDYSHQLRNNRPEWLNIILRGIQKEGLLFNRCTIAIPFEHLPAEELRILTEAIERLNTGGVGTEPQLFAVKGFFKDGEPVAESVEPIQPSTHPQALLARAITPLQDAANYRIAIDSLTLISLLEKYAIEALEID